MSDYDLVLVDGLNLFFRNQHKLGHLSTSEGSTTGGLYGSIRSILKIVKDYKPDFFMVCWDGGNQSRTAIDPEYKANRERSDDQGMWNQLEVLSLMMDDMGFGQHWEPGKEADDLIAEFTYDATQGGHTTLIVSEDHDFLQLLSPSTTIFKPMKKELITDEHFREWYGGLPPWRYPEIQAITGCGTDNISGVPRVGEKTALKYLQRHGFLGRTLAKESKLTEFTEKILTNLQLVRLHGSLGSSVDYMLFKVPEQILRPTRVLYSLEQFEMNSIVNNLEKNDWKLK